MTARWLLPLAPALCWASAAAAQDVPAQSTSAPTPASAPAPVEKDGLWIASASTGIVARDDDAARPLGTFSLSRKIGEGYVQMSVSRYDYVIQQIDATLPSTYTIASLSGGRRFGNWFADAYGSLGYQAFGPVETALGKRASTAGKGAPVFGYGADIGHWFTLSPHLYASATIAGQYGWTRLLRQGFAFLGGTDFQTPESALSGSVTARLDRTFTADNGTFVGMAVTQNVARYSLSPPDNAPLAPELRSSDGWKELEAHASVGLSKNVWLDLSGSRTFGLAAGDTTFARAGLRLRF